MFLQVSNFVITNKNDSNYEHVIFKSIVLGYIFQFPYNIVPSITGDNIYIDTAIFIALCVVGGYLWGRLYRSIILGLILRKLNIHHTVNDNIWYDIIDYEKNLIVYATLKENGMKYVGVLKTLEDFQRKPLIVLNQYSLYDKENKLLVDNTGKLNECTVIDTSECSRIDLLYDETSYKVTSKNLKPATKSKSPSVEDD